MRNLTFLHTSFEKIFCQNKIMRNRKIVICDICNKRRSYILIKWNINKTQSIMN